MERAIDRIFMTLLISVDPFLHRRIAENEVGVAHVEMGDLPMVGRKPEFAKSFACSFALVVSGIKRIQVTGGQKNALAERGVAASEAENSALGKFSYEAGKKSGLRIGQ